MTKQWEFAQQHNQDVRLIAKLTCNFSKDGFVTKYDGEAYWAKMEQMGHSSTRFEQCKCRVAKLP